MPAWRGRNELHGCISRQQSTKWSNPFLTDAARILREVDERGLCVARQQTICGDFQGAHAVGEPVAGAIHYQDAASVCACFDVGARQLRADGDDVPSAFAIPAVGDVRNQGARLAGCGDEKRDQYSQIHSAQAKVTQRAIKQGKGQEPHLVIQ